jgi:hypothetical protein
MNRIESAEDRSIVNGHVARALGRIRDDNIVSHMTVVRQVHVRHDKATSADCGLIRCGSGTVDRGILPDDGAGPNLDPGFLPIVLEVLRIAT